MVVSIVYCSAYSRYYLLHAVPAWFQPAPTHLLRFAPSCARQLDDEEMDEILSREIQGLLEEDEPTCAELRAERALPVQTWPGITASASGCVKHLYLERNSLSGTCPDYFTHFNRITALSLGEHGACRTQSLPPVARCMLPSLARQARPTSLPPRTTKPHLAAHNDISGPISPHLGSLVTLKILNLSCNNFEGPICERLAMLTNLTHLWLYANKLDGKIPKEILSVSGLTNLVSLRLNRNLCTCLLTARACVRASEPPPLCSAQPHAT